MCTGAEVDWNLIDSDDAGVKLWLDRLDRLRIREEVKKDKTH